MFILISVSSVARVGEQQPYGDSKYLTVFSNLW